MAVTARAIATQGIGFGALSLALAGFVTAQSPTTPVTRRPSCSHFAIVATTVDRGTILMSTSSDGAIADTVSDTGVVALVTTGTVQLETVTESVGVVEACAT